MNRKEAKREQARPRSISQKSPMEAAQPEKPSEPYGTYGFPRFSVGCSHGRLRRWGHRRLTHPEGSLLGVACKETGKEFPRAPSRAWALTGVPSTLHQTGQITLKQGGRGLQSKDQGRGTGDYVCTNKAWRRKSCRRLQTRCAHLQFSDILQGVMSSIV